MAENRQAYQINHIPLNHEHERRYESYGTAVMKSSSREPFPKTPTQLPTLSQTCRKQIFHKPCSYNPEKPKKQDYFQRRN